MNDKPKPDDLKQVDMNKLQKMAADLPGLLEYAHTVGGFAIVPTEEGVIKSQALKAMNEQAQEKLDQIVEQMKLLARQAQDLKDRVNVSQGIYQAKITFKPIIGNTYYFYEKKKDSRKILSIVSPDEWGEALNDLSFIAKVKLLADHTWKILKD